MTCQRPRRFLRRGFVQMPMMRELAGHNHHGVGYGNIAEAATGYPGYDSITGPETALPR